MTETKIKLGMTDDIKELVKITCRYDYDIDLQSGRYVIDGKSILGIFSLDLKNPISVLIHSDDCDDLLTELKPFAVE